MPKRLYATDPSHVRTVIFRLRLSVHEYAKLLKLTDSAGARNPSDFARRKLLGWNQEFKVPPFETLRDVRNAVVKVGIGLQELREAVGNAKTLKGWAEARDGVIRAMDKISKF